MSRYTHIRQQQQLLAQQQQQMADNDAAAAAAEMFDMFCLATTMRQILGLHRNMCDTVGLRPAPLNEFYPKLKAKIRSWKAQALWKKFDARAAHRAYSKGNACTGTRVLVIGAGPCGLRTAIEAQLLGAKVVVVEKRDRISRNNVLHLWPFVITDLRNLGAKKFYGKFCAGSIDHISIRQLQCILLKVALLLGVEIHEGVSFERTIEPSEGCGWRAAISPEDHAVSHYEFDVLIGADGKRNTLEAFKRKEFRGKLAIAITANFINKKTEAEAKAEEISGVAFIFNQTFFKELYHTTGIDLENIVYYKDETHYFVMTAKKHSLIDKGVILQDFADPAELLAPPNVNTEKLLDYAREAAEFSTKYQMPNLEFAVNHYGKPDVAMFDFTSMFAAESSCRVIVRKNYRLLQCLVGDSLLEPFWPTGSGCARGFLSSMDAAYAIKLWNNSRNSILGVLAQRESIYRLLAQTTPENLQRDIGSYTVDPATRYPNLNRTSVNVWQVKHLIDSDDKSILEQTFMDTNALQASQAETPIRRKRRTGDTLPLSAVLLRWIKAQLHSYEFTQNLNEVSDCFTNGKVLCALINRYRPDLVDFNSVKELPASESNDLAFKILDKELKISRVMSGKDSIELDKIDSKIWLNYLEQICEVFRGEIPHVKHPKLDVSELREKNRNNAPDFSRLLQMSSRKAKSPMQDVADTPHVVQRRSVLDEEKVKRQRKHESGQGAQAETPRRAKKRRSAEKTQNIDRERGISSAMPRGADEQFSDRIKSMEQRITSRNAYGTDKKPKDLLRAIGKIDSNDWNVREIEKKIEQSKKTETGGKGREKVPKWSKEQFVARQSKMSKPTRQDSGEEKFKEIDQTLKNLDKQLKEGSVLEVGERGKNKVASIAGQFVKKDDTSEEKNPPPIAKSNSKVALAFKKQAASEKCHFCKQTVYLMEKISTEGLILHRSCLKCHHCHTNLRLGGYAFDRDDPEGRFYCTQHFRLPAKAIRPVVRKPGQRKSTAHGSHAAGGADAKTPEKPRGIAENVVQLDLLDRGQTPERIEFENTDAMSDGEPSEEHIIDENEWSGRNFLQPSADSESDLMSSSDESDDDSESDMFEEANGSPIAQQTLQLATDWIGKQHYSNVNSDDSDDDFYDSSEGLIDDGKDDTEGEEFKKAREMRREEVRLLPLPTNLPTDTETENQRQVVGPQDGSASAQKTDDVSSERVIDRDADKISLSSRASDQMQPPSKADIEKIEQNSDRRFSADVDAISEKLYRLNNLMKMNKDIESMAKENLVKSDILKKLSLKEKWLLDNSVSNAIPGPLSTFDDKVKVDESPVVEKEVPKESTDQLESKESTEKVEDKESTEIAKEVLPSAPVESVSNGDDDRGDGLQIKPTQGDESRPEESHEEQKENVTQLPSEKMEIEGILDIVKLMDTSYIEPSKEPLPSPKSSPKSSPRDVGKMLYDAEHKNENRLGDALHQIEVKNFAGTMDTIKSQMVTPTISHQGSLDISKYFPNAKQEKQTSGAVNKNQKTLKDVDLTKYFPQSPVPQRKTSVTTVADRLKKSQTEKAIALDAPEPPKAPPRRQKSMAATTDKTFSIHEHLLDGAIDIQKAPVVKPVARKGVKIVKKIVPKGTKAKKAAAAAAASKKPQDEADKILDEILHSGQDVRSPSLEYQKLFTEEKSPSEDVSEKIEKILEETGIDLGLPPKPKKKLLKAKSLGEEEFKRTQERMQSSKEDGDRPSGVQRILQRFESMSSIKSDESFRSKKSLFSSTCSLNKSRESLRSKDSLVSNTESVTDLEKTMEYLKSEWRTEATNFLQQKRESFYASRKAKPVEEVPVKRPIQPEPQWKETKYSKFFGIKEKSPEKRKSPTKLTTKRKSPVKMLKKSPREEILKHRKKVESVSSRRASFEEKIKEEEARLRAEEAVKAGSRKASLEGKPELQNGHGSNGGSRRASLKMMDDEAKPQEVKSKIPISQGRKDTQPTSVVEKLLSRRGSGTSGLADVLKPPVVKGIRGPQAKPEQGSGSEDALKAVLNLMRQGSQTSVNGKDGVESQSRRGSKTEEVLNHIANEIKTQITTADSSLDDGQIQAKKIEVSQESEKLSSQRPTEIGTTQSRRGSQAGALNQNPGAGQIQASEISFPGSQVVDNDKTLEPKQILSRRASEVEEISKTSQPQSRRGSQKSPTVSKTSTPITLSRKNSAALETAPTVSRRSSNISVTLDDTITVDDITDVDEIFDEIVSELDKNEGPAPLIETSNFQKEEIIAIASELVEEEQPSESQQIDEEFKKIANKRNRSSSEDSIEKLFSEFTDDMLVDVEFDSNDEVVAITPRAVLVNENERDEEEKDVVEQKHITIEEAKLKFEPLFPGQQRRVAKSSSSSMSTSPRRTETKARTILKKLDPADMAPSVQDVMQKIIAREESEPIDSVPMAFPRFIYESGSDDSPRSSGSRTQTPETEKDKEPSKKKQHLEVVYELAWPARKRMPSPVPESARPPIKPVMVRGGSTSRRSSNSSIEPRLGMESVGQLEKTNSPERSMMGAVNDVLSAPKDEVDVLTVNSNEPANSPSKARSAEKEDSRATSRRSSKASPPKAASVEQEVSQPAPRRDSRGSPPKAASVEQEASQSTSRRSSKASPPKVVSIEPEAPMQTSRRNSGGSPPKAASVEQQTSRKDSKGSPPKAVSIELVASQPTSRRGSKTSTQEESIVQRGSPALLPTPRRGSRTSIDGEKVNSNQEFFSSKISPNDSPFLPSTPRRSSAASNDVQALEIEPSSPRRDSLAEVSSEHLKVQSQSPDVEASSSRRGSKTSPTKVSSKSPEVHLSTSRRESKVSPPKQRGKSPKTSPRSNSSSEGSKIVRESPEMTKTSTYVQTVQEESKQSVAEIISPQKETTTFRNTPSKEPSKLAVNGQHKSSVSPPKLNSREEPVSDESKTTSSYKSPNRASLQRIDVHTSPKQNEIEEDQQNTSTPLNSSPIGTPKSDSPITARDKERSLDWDMSKIPSSARNSREKIISKPQQEPSKEYKDLLRSKLESSSFERRSRNPSQSKEPSLEWDMEQLPRSPMPRRKYVDSLLNDKENSFKPTNIPSPSPVRTVIPEKPLPTKRLEEWEIIEQLERERRLALIKRDENYTNQIHENSSKSVSWQPAPAFNRLESLEEPQSSKLIEYIKQQTLSDSSRQKDDSPKPPSRPRTPQLSKASTEDLNKQVEALLKTQEPKPLQRRPQMQKTESTEATYEDFARFTRRSVDEEPEPEPVAHHRLSNHRQKSPESVSGTYSPSSSLSKSTEHLAPSRPHRNKPTATSVPEDRVDRETKYLIDRSKHLRNMKRDFMEEKIAGNNPYLKKVIEAQKVSRDSDEEDEVDYALESYRPKNHTTPRFPTSSSITGRRRREPRYPDYTSTTSDYSRRAYSPHYSTASTSAAAGSRNFVDYFKRSPPHYKARESSKDSCVIS